MLPIGGHTVSVTIKACASDGYGEPCITKSRNFDIPSPSDAQLKENFEAVDRQLILSQVAELPITTWNYRDPEKPGRHIGPMAQDFYRLFEVGQSQEFISAIDSYGVSLAAIQALNEVNNEQASEIETLRLQNETLTQQTAQLAARIEALEAHRNTFEYTVFATLSSLILIGFVSGYLVIKSRRNTEISD